MTDNVRLTRDLTSTKEKLESVENVFESTTCELRRANKDLTVTKAMLKQRESKLEKAQSALKNSEAHHRSKAVDSKEAQDKAASAEKKVQQTEEMLELKEIELQQKKEMLASRAMELQHAQKELASTKTAVDSGRKDVERIKKELDRANTRAQEYQNKGLKLEGEFNIQKKVLEDTTRNLNKWGNESNKQRNEIINQLRPEILRLRDQLAKGQSGHDEYVRKTRRIIYTLEEEKQLLQHTQNSAASQKEIARLQKILVDEQPIRRDAQHQVHELQKVVDRFGDERAFYQEQYGRHHMKVDKLKRDLAESASRLIRISSYDEVEQLKVEINQLKTAANRKDFECKADREKFDKAKENAVEQIKKLGKEVKELKDQLKEAEDAAKGAREGLEEVEILRGELAEKEKQLQLEKNKAEAAEVARKYLLSKGLAKTQEYQAFEENHAQQAQTGLGAGEDDVTKKHGRDAADSGVVVGARDPKRQQE
jgi:chromosome segregation ATPase